MQGLVTLPALLERLQPPSSARRLPLLHIGLAILAGALHAASIAWPFGGGLSLGQPVWWLQLLSLAILVWQLAGAAKVWHAAWLGWWFAVAMQCATWWWLYVSLHTYGGLASSLAVLGIVGLAGFLALYYLTICACFRALVAVNSAYFAIIFASLWLLAELGRVAFFTGFPWGEGGYAQLDGPFDNLAKLVGVHGLTFGAALAAAALAGLAGKQRRAQPAVLLLAGVLLAGAASFALRVGGDQTAPKASYFTAPTPGAISVTLLQGNIAQDEKFRGASGVPDALTWYGQQLRAAQTDLVVTPETALPLLPSQLPEGYLEALTDRFTRPAAGSKPIAALVGIPLGSFEVGYTNSVIGLKPGGTDSASAYRYDKHHLVPFGEFVHPLFKWFLDIVNMPLADFNRGAVSQPSFSWRGQQLAPNICYEDLFGEELAARFAGPGPAPTAFVNISNIGWFGNTIAIDQHLAISRLRAIEFERPMIRATNTGATIIIDHAGRVTDSLPRHTRGALVGSVHGRTGVTPYAWWAARWGLWPWWGLCVAIVLLAAGRRFHWAKA